MARIPCHFRVWWIGGLGREEPGGAGRSDPKPVEGCGGKQRGLLTGGDGAENPGEVRGEVIQCGYRIPWRGCRNPPRRETAAAAVDDRCGWVRGAEEMRASVERVDAVDVVEPDSPQELLRAASLVTDPSNHVMCVRRQERRTDVSVGEEGTEVVEVVAGRGADDVVARLVISVALTAEFVQTRGVDAAACGRVVVARNGESGGAARATGLGGRG